MPPFKTVEERVNDFVEDADEALRVMLVIAPAVADLDQAVNSLGECPHGLSGAEYGVVVDALATMRRVLEALTKRGVELGAWTE